MQLEVIFRQELEQAVLRFLLIYLMDFSWCCLLRVTLFRGPIDFVKVLLLLFEIFEVLLGFQLRDLLDLALERHVGFLQILNVLVLHLVHVDRFQNLQVLSQDMVAMPVIWPSLLIATEVLVLRNKNVAVSAHFGL